MIPHLLCRFFAWNPEFSQIQRRLPCTKILTHTGTSTAIWGMRANFENPKCLALVASHGGVSAVVAGRSGCLGGCTILPYCSRTFVLCITTPRSYALCLRYLLFVHRFDERVLPWRGFGAELTRQQVVWNSSNSSSQQQSRPSVLPDAMIELELVDRWEVHAFQRAEVCQAAPLWAAGGAVAPGAAKGPSLWEAF